MIKKIAGPLAAGLVLAAATASHALTINATFNSSITSAPNAAAIEASINNAIQFYSQFNNAVTVSIDFKAVTTGLGGSETGLYGASYNDFTAALAANSALNPQNAVLKTALANLQYGNQQGTIAGTSADFRALGFTGANPGVTGPGSDGVFDGVISLNTSIMNFTDTVSNTTPYWATSVIQHEVDEVLGMGGPGSLPDQPFGPGIMGAQDLYRYSAPHTASFTTDPTAVSYFSIDGGNTDIRKYNQDASKGDLGDWVTDCSQAQFVQDYAGCPGGQNISLNLSSPEVTGLQAIGYNLTAPIPEPAAWALMITGFGLTGAALRRRRVATPVRVRS